MKEELTQNAKETLKLNLKKEMGDISENLMNESYDIIADLMDKVSENALFSFDTERVISSRKDITRDNFKFPGVLNIGMLKNWLHTPSDIIDSKESFFNEAPFLVPFSTSGIGFFSHEKYKKEIENIMETSMLKFITSLPDGMVRVTVIDKTGSGQSFPTTLKLNSKFMTSNVLTDDKMIEEVLLSLKNDINRVSKSITANGFNSIEDYNKNSGQSIQPYNLILIANYPIGFSKKASEALLAILNSGYNAGIYTLMTVALDQKHGLNQPIDDKKLSDFIKYLSFFQFSDIPSQAMRDGKLVYNINMLKAITKNSDDIRSAVNNKFTIELEEIKETDIILEELNDKISNMNLRPLINIEDTIPSEIWGNSAGKGISVPFAKNGIENVHLDIGINRLGEDSPTHHGLICGATGSGKTVTLHDIILHASLKYSPKDLNFWLLDYKEGTEFATYKNFPHVQILSMESEIEFGHDVLNKAIDLIEERGVLFKKVGVGNLANYNKSVEEKDILPRIVIIIDEFQSIFPSAQPALAKKSNNLIDVILRKGRSFGVNLFLATQTLQDLPMEAQLLSNMPLRIALMMNEKDIKKLMSEDNLAPKYLKFPGEGVYNPKYGDPKENSNFQAYFASEDGVNFVKETIQNKFDITYDEYERNAMMKSRFVYAGDFPGTVNKNKSLNNRSKNKIFIGEPAGLSKEHNTFIFSKTFGDHMLVVGPDTEKATNIFINTYNQLIEKKSETIFLNYNSSLDDKLEKELIGGTFYKNRDSEDKLNKIIDELRRRDLMDPQEVKSLNHIYFINFFIDQGKIFTDTSLGKDSNISKIQEILDKGSELGIHMMIYGTSFKSLSASNISRELEKFKKKVALNGGGQALKIFGEDSFNLTFARSEHSVIGHNGKVGSSYFKFKPYNDNVKDYSPIEED
jgi:hypothetical protein